MVLLLEFSLEKLSQLSQSYAISQAIRFLNSQRECQSFHLGRSLNQIITQIFNGIFWSIGNYFFESFLDNLSKLILQKIGNSYFFLDLGRWFGWLIISVRLWSFLLVFESYLEVSWRRCDAGVGIERFGFSCRSFFYCWFILRLLFVIHYLYNNIGMLSQSELEEVYKMVDSVPFSRVKKNINRDFSDALMMAELVYYYSPKLVQLHNYPPANSLAKKIQNWNTLHLKVLKRIGISLSKQEIEGLANGAPGFIEETLHQIYLKFEKTEEEGRLSRNGKVMEGKVSKKVRSDWPQQQTSENNGETSAQKRRVQQNSETQQLLALVAKIDAANEKLFQLKQQSTLKDQIIQNLEKKIEKLIFN